MTVTGQLFLLDVGVAHVLFLGLKESQALR